MKIPVRPPLHVWALVPLLLMALMALPSPAAAQAGAQGASVEYTEARELQAAGFLGAMLARAHNDDGPHLHAIHVLGPRLRSDDGSTSTIFDAEAGAWIILDHDQQTYMSSSLADMRQMSDQMAQGMREAEDEWDPETQAEMEAAMAEAEATMEVNVEYIDMAQTEQINGYSADRHQIIVRVEGAEGVEGAEDVDDGSLVVVLDVWLSRELAQEHPLWAGHGEGADNPFYQALMENPEYQELAREWESAFEPGSMEGELTLFAMVDPRVGAAMSEALEEMAELDGSAVRSTAVVAILPPAVELDTEMLVAWEPASMGDRLQGEASQAAVEAARGAARDMVRGFLGRRGGGDDEPQVAEEELVIQPLVRYTTEVLEVRRGEIPSPEMFTIPDGYRELVIPMPEGQPEPR